VRPAEFLDGADFGDYAAIGACRQPPARAKFARIYFRPAISLMLKPKEIHSPNFKTL